MVCVSVLQSPSIVGKMGGRVCGMHLVCRGSGPAILFIHGMPTNSELWCQIVERLCGKFTCFAVDLPGFGQTPRETYSVDYLQRLAERIEALRIENGVEEWRLVGHDAGSAVAVQYAALFPERVARMVLLSPALFPDLRPYFLLNLLRTPVLGEVLAPAVSPLFWNVAMRRAVQCEEEVPGPCFRTFKQRFGGFTGAWELMRVMRWGKPRDVLANIPSCLSQLRVRTSILYASRDAAIPRKMALRAAALIPDAVAQEVDSGHFIPLNRPGFVAEHLAEFLGNESPSTSSQHPRATLPDDRSLPIPA